MLDLNREVDTDLVSIAKRLHQACDTLNGSREPDDRAYGMHLFEEALLDLDLALKP